MMLRVAYALPKLKFPNEFPSSKNCNTFYQASEKAIAEGGSGQKRDQNCSWAYPITQVNRRTAQIIALTH